MISVRFTEHVHVHLRPLLPLSLLLHRCGYITSQKLCKACLLLQDLDRRRQSLLNPPKGTISYES